MRALRNYLVPVIAAAALAACDRNPTSVNNLPVGTFEGDVSGVLDDFIEGSAESGSTVDGFHDLIILSDFSGGAEITIYHATDEFRDGRTGIGDFETANVVADIYFADQDRYFVSVDGTLDVFDIDSRGIDGEARFRAVEVDGFGDPIFGSEVVVDVAFRTDYDPFVSFNRSPSFEVRAKN